MSQDSSTHASNEPAGKESVGWVRFLPDGAISVELEGAHLVLRASQKLQARFEDLLERRKAGTLSTSDSDEYKAICELDVALSWLNRLARGARSES